MKTSAGDVRSEIGGIHQSHWAIKSTYTPLKAGKTPVVTSECSFALSAFVSLHSRGHESHTHTHTQRNTHSYKHAHTPDRFLVYIYKISQFINQMLCVHFQSKSPEITTITHIIHILDKVKQTIIRNQIKYYSKLANLTRQNETAVQVFQGFFEPFRAKKPEWLSLIITVGKKLMECMFPFSEITQIFFFFFAQTF